MDTNNAVTRALNQPVAGADPAVMKALRLYRGRGILLSLYCQGRFSLQDAGYSEAAI